MSDEYIFAIDFTHENMNAAFVSLMGSAEGGADFDLCDFQAGESRAMDKLLALLLAKAKAAPGPLVATAVSLPCDIDAKRMRVMGFPQAGWLEDQPLPEVLGKALGMPVVMEKRAIVRLAYDRVMLGLPEASLILGCYVDLHYETAIWHSGHPIRGKNGTAGSIAHIPIHGREDACFCGKTGCVNMYGAGVRLRQMHSMIFPDTPLPELFARHGEHPLVLDYLTMMAYPIAIEANIIDPEYIIIGGEVPVMKGFPMDFLREQVRALMYRPDPGAETNFLASSAASIPGTVCLAQYAMVELGML